ncbi:hypothetical protein HO173_005475 [Letharia columbiana]|uniref:Uncharacterized protein n=1 Tax=Letharia columbiana TaxID=112416 RepID=A0A8H6FX59_9LECA|nr:uncharacterized protein HO173_005475 [Letharia columbiana]KAF6236384.1 hypothetical protein HO173_005475 [Letharia columbiana]
MHNLLDGRSKMSPVTLDEQETLLENIWAAFERGLTKTVDEIDDGLLFFYGGVLLLIVVAKHNRAEMLNPTTVLPTIKSRNILSSSLLWRNLCYAHAREQHNE